MLRALELAGFKSFADRTRLEFPQGVTAVVGPNGSGKSNVVDAVKWVLGAQSIKGLRGKEKNDVIFSGTRDRRPAGAAEVSLILDRWTGVGDDETRQVQISRRLYRSGETEYLIDRRPCRLRDIRDVLAETGVASGAYSIIEQGKVDALLQSSPADRRLIFEEAAGISRFKAKRHEAGRRLERVEQNLTRLTDIVTQLQLQVTRVQSQAGKANQHKEAAGSLRELQTRLWLAGWRRLTAEIARHEEALAAQNRQLSDLEHQVAQGDAEVVAQDQLADELHARVREMTAEVASVRERIAQCETRRQSQVARIEELKEETERLAHQLLMMTSRADDSEQLVQQTTSDLQEAEERHEKTAAEVEQGEAKLALADANWKQAQDAEDAVRADLEQMRRQGSQLQNEVQVLAVQHESASGARARREAELREVEENFHRITQDHARAVEGLQTASVAATKAAAELEQLQQRIRTARTRQAALQEQHAELQSQLSGARERMAVLEELERRLEGLNGGTKEALRLAQENPTGPFGAICGVVADLLHVDADLAQLIEIVLGERANFLVAVDGKQLEPALIEASTSLTGRLTVLRLDVPTPASAVDHLDLSSESGVVGRADHFVESAPELSPLVKRLLGRHWLVDALPTALHLASGRGRGLNFVTVAGELVTSDGALSVGPRQTTAGMLSRRSELRSLAERVAALQHEIEENQTNRDALDNELTDADATLQELTARHAAVSEQAASAQAAEVGLAERLARIEKKRAVLTAECEQAEQSDRDRTAQLTEYQTRLEECQQGEAAAVGILKSSQVELQSCVEEVERTRKVLTEARIALAGSGQRRDGLQRQMMQLQMDYEERDRALAETRERATQCVEARSALEKSNEQLAVEGAELASRRDALGEELATAQNTVSEARGRRTEAAKQADAIRQKYFQCQKDTQQRQLQTGQIEHERAALSQRMRDAYHVELSELSVEMTDEPVTDRAAVEAEIRRLKTVLDGLGPVNLEAVEELDSLEARCLSLSAQHDDLQAARKHFSQMVTQINSESRRLFAETVEEVRGHFRELFAKLFDGGEADIVVVSEEGEDLLECGIDIIARPPGKQPRSISLLSGGERTLTCVALLLGLFKSRPSPFCILDEVDAALDEANIDRFVQVLEGLTEATQFVIITHSKRTMSCSDTLHGITMQSSGISKRVSVRFEDVGRDGQIRPAAVREAERRAA
ncbi:chromosome segregation protein SMC [Pirellulales bacterium]|nr:chromosome segregation protein SMC [Pirellulales bacterium]